MARSKEWLSWADYFEGFIDAIELKYLCTHPGIIRSVDGTPRNSEVVVVDARRLPAPIVGFTHVVKCVKIDGPCGLSYGLWRPIGD